MTNTDQHSPVRSRPFRSWPFFEEDEIQAAVAVLRSGKVNYWTGNEGREFEREFADYVGCKHAIALANGTVALELALRVAGVAPGDEVIVTPRSFVASASCAVTVGATPVFADIDPDSGNITSRTIKKVLSPRTKAIIPVHLGGWPCDMDPIMELAEEHSLKVIEDCAQAHGAIYKGRQVGSLGHIGAFSFCQDKIMTTGGEGGMLTTNDSGYWDAAWTYKEHGKSYEVVYQKQHPPGFRWLHEFFGTNFRLTEMQAAMGRIMLKKLPRSVAVRRRNAEFLTERFLKVPALRVTTLPSDIFHSSYRYYVYVRPDALKPEWNRDRIIEALIAEGIPGHSGACGEIYLEKAFEKALLQPPERLPIAAKLGAESLMFLVHPALQQDDLDDMCTALEKVMATASR